MPRSPQGLLSVRLGTMIAAFVLLLSTNGGRAQSSGSFEPVGLQPERGYFGQLPFESIDMVTGNLVLTFTDLALPGNGGMNLRVVRSMNYGGATGPVWTAGPGGVPIALEGMTAPPTGPWTVGVVMADRSRRQVLHQSGVDTYVLDNFMRVTLSSRTVELPNGWVATYETTAGVTQAQLTEVHDPFGNSITATWLPRGGGITTATGISSLELRGGNDPVRTVYFTYDATGVDLLSMQFEGRTWSYTSNANHALTSVTPPAGPGWQFTYATNQLTVTMPYGGTVEYNFQTVQDPSGHQHPVVVSRTVGGRAVPAGTWAFTYDRGGDPTIGRVTTPDGRQIEFRHQPIANPAGGSYWNLTRKSLSAGGGEVARLDRVYTSCGDNFSPMVSQDTLVQQGRTFHTTYEYASLATFNCHFHRPWRIVQSGDLTRTSVQDFTYPVSTYRADLVASSVVTVGGQSADTSYTYTQQGFATSATTLGVQTLIAADAAGNVASVTDPNGRTTSFTYQFGAVKNTQTPLYTITRTINSDGSIGSETRRGIQTTFSYDALGRPIAVSAPGRDTTSIAYWPDATVTTTGATVVTESFDGVGRATAVSNTVGVSTSTIYDAEGRVVTRGYPSGGGASATDTFSYDALGRVTSVAHSGGGMAQTVYSGATVLSTDENGRTTTQNWLEFAPGDGRLASVVDPNSQTWQYSYNGFGSLTGVTQPGGSTRSFSYDARNRLTSEVHPESGTTTYAHDDAGNVLTRQDAKGTTFQYTYDANNRLTRVSGLGGDDVAVGYDDSDNRTSLTTGAVTSTFVYDVADRLTSRTDIIAGRTFASGYTYDGRGNVLSVTYPSGRVIQYEYDAGNRVTRVFDGAQNYASGIAYHPSGALAGLTFGNGTTEATTFDGRYRVQQRASGPLGLAYGYDAAGNVTSIADARPEFSSSFTYDVLDRLRFVTGWGANEYQYDALGNRTWEANGNVTSSYDAQLRLAQRTGFGATSYTYDQTGNLKTEAGATYDYTPSNLLRAAKVAGIETAYGYDGDDQRVIRTGPEGTTYSVRGGGSAVLAEYEDAGSVAALVREYVYLGGKLIASIGRDPNAPVPPISVALTSPQAGAEPVEGATVTFIAQPRLTSGAVSRVEFYANGLLLGSATNAPYTITRNDLTQGSYKILARVVTVAGGVASSAAVPISIVRSNPPPAVTLTSPANNVVLGTGWTSTLAAAASDTDGIAKVEFYRGTFLLGTDTAAPFSHAWTNLQAGTYVLTAKAYDALGAVATSAPVNVIVRDVANITVSPTSPAVGASATVNIDGLANCGALTMDYGDGPPTTYGISGLPVSFTHVWASGGAKTVSATGQAGCSGTATTTVNVLGAPAVSLTAPAGGTTFVAPASVNLSASATASQGTIARVDFYANGTLLSSDTAAPYGYSWTGVGPGTYSLTATAYDTFNVPGTSAPVNVAVHHIGTLAVSPSPPTAGVAATVTLYGAAGCNNVLVNYGDGTIIPYTISSLPASFSHTWTTGGPKTVTATGEGTCTGTATTTINVNVPPSISLSPAPGSTFIAPVGLEIVATVGDVDGYVWAVEFSDGISLTTDYAAPFTRTWPNVPVGTHTIYAAAHDNNGGYTLTSTTFTVVAPGVTGITVSPASPTAGTASLVTVHGLATCGAVTLDYGDGNVITYGISGLPASFSHTWSTAGAKTLVATGQGGGCPGSASTGISVLGPPYVALTSPSGSANYLAPATISLAAAASAAQGAIAKVDFYANGTLINTDTATPYAFTWSGVGAGSYTLTAIATDTYGASAASSSVTVSVGDPPPSTVLAVTVSPNPVGVGAGATILVTGTNPCGMVALFFGNEDFIYVPIYELPLSYPYAWYSPGTYTVTAIGMGNCSGQVSTTVTVSGMEPVPLLSMPVEIAPGVLVDEESSDHESELVLGTPDLTTSLMATTPLAAPALAVAEAVNALVQVDLNGTGSGSVSGSINCTGQNTNCSATFTAGATVTLTATPAAGMVFGGWTGGCSGTAATCTVTAADQLLVVANFRASVPMVTSYYHLDALGSVRAITNAAGAIIERHDYRPFGEDNQPLPAPGTDPARFLSQPRDETRLDYFVARYYAMTNGRFTSVDPVINPAALVLPQKWNRYAYARNNPLRFMDPTGLDDGDIEIGIPPCTEICQEFDDWADGLSSSWRRQFLLAQALAAQAGGGSGSAGGGGAIVTTTETFRLAPNQITDPFVYLATDIFGRAGGIEPAIRAVAILVGSAVAPGATSVLDCLAGGSCSPQGLLIGGLGRASGPVLAVAGQAGSTIFKTSHYASRLRAVGVNVTRAEAEVGKAIQGMRPNMVTGADVAGRMRIDNVLVEYRARLLPNGTVNVGTIFPVR